MNVSAHQSQPSARSIAIAMPGDHSVELSAPTRAPSPAMTSPAIKPLDYDFDEKGNIDLPDGAPFDGEPVLVKLATGWCEAWWDAGRQINSIEGVEVEGFCWVCMDDQFQAELDDVKFWTELPNIARSEELRAAYERIAQLESDLNECREFLEDQVDVVDGSYGEPAPNRAMVLVSMIDLTLDGPGGF